MHSAAWFWTEELVMLTEFAQCIVLHDSEPVNLVMLTVCTVSSAAWFWTKELAVLTEFAQCILLHDSEPKNLLCWEFTQCVLLHDSEPKNLLCWEFTQCILLHDSEPKNSFCWQSLHRVYCSTALTQGTATKQTTPILPSTPSSTQLICRWVAFRHSPMNEWSTQLICRWVAFRHSPMNECVIICEANEIFRTRLCNVTAHGLGRKKHTFSYTLWEAQWVKHTNTHRQMRTKDKGVGELQASMKEVSWEESGKNELSSQNLFLWSNASLNYRWVYTVCADTWQMAFKRLLIEGFLFTAPSLISSRVMTQFCMSLSSVTSWPAAPRMHRGMKLWWRLTWQGRE